MKNRKINFGEIGAWSFWGLWLTAFKFFKPEFEDLPLYEIAINHYTLPYEDAMIHILLYDLEVGYTEYEMSSDYVNAY